MRGEIKLGDSIFPKALEQIKGCPKSLYYQGDLSILDMPTVAVVGSRNCTMYGKTVARTIGEKLGERDVAVVSGLARGIDTSAHKGALSTNGKTIAILGCGIDVCYPVENLSLRDEIAEKGLLLSEYPLGFTAKPYTFPMRNRIISGISDSVVIVEAGNRSGALITAESAAEQGKNLYAVPGNITSYYSFGTNKLIRESVTPLILIDDLLIDLGINPNINEENVSKMGKDELKIYSAIQKSGELTIDELCRTTNLSVAKISGILTILEMKGAIFSEMGKFLVAKF